MSEPFDTKLFIKKYFELKLQPEPRTYSKGWTPERCQKARDRCLKHQPWKYSTGAKTPEGKRKVSMNALKHGEHTQAMRFVTDILNQVKSL